MQINLNRNKSVEVDMDLAQSIKVTINDALQRFSDEITRVEGHLSDVNGNRSGRADKRCLMEVRVARRNPVVVTNEGATSEIAESGAAQDMTRLLTSTFARLGERK
jgi:hypothetical protein